MSAYDLVVFRWGFRAGDPSLVTLFTSMFLHAGFMHLAGNMLYLWVYGNNVEHRLGALSYVLWYLATGVAATLFQTLFNPGSPIPLVGASGAISGVLGFYLVWFPHHTVRLFLFLFPFYVGTVRLSATLVLVLYLILDNLLPFLIAPQGAGVAHGAHIGGFLAGMAVAWLMRRRRR
jgi:membrane associated rhomboid family serine protease